VSDFSEQTVVRQGSLVFCVNKSSEVERERRSPLGQNERVYGENLDTDAHSNGKYGITSI